MINRSGGCLLRQVTGPLEDLVTEFTLLVDVHRRGIFLAASHRPHDSVIGLALHRGSRVFVVDLASAHGDGFSVFVGDKLGRASGFGDPALECKAKVTKSSQSRVCTFLSDNDNIHHAICLAPLLTCLRTQLDTTRCLADRLESVDLRDKIKEVAVGIRSVGRHPQVSVIEMGNGAEQARDSDLAELKVGSDTGFHVLLSILLAKFLGRN